MIDIILIHNNLLHVSMLIERTKQLLQLLEQRLNFVIWETADCAIGTDKSKTTTCMEILILSDYHFCISANSVIISSFILRTDSQAKQNYYG